MYTIRSEQSFDAAHFLSGYDGKCKNIHGHRWRVLVEIQSKSLQTDTQLEGMIVDFKELKRDIKEVVDYFDHALIIEEHSLKETTYQALLEEGFRVVKVDFRPTAERFSKYFYDKITEKGYR